MSDIFREVDEEVRQEQIINFVKTYGKYVLAGVVAAIVVFGGIRWYESSIRAEREAAGERFQDALSLLVSDKVAEAISDFAVVEEESGGEDSYGLLARFRRAEALYESREVQAAKNLYDAIAADSSVDTVYRDLAGLFAAIAILDTAGDEELLERLEPLTEEGNAWRLSALEMAGLVHYRKGNLDDARTMYEQIIEEAPEGTAFVPRAQQMLAIIGPGVDTSAEGTE